MKEKEARKERRRRTFLNPRRDDDGWDANAEAVKVERRILGQKVSSNVM
jgi:hypothetical protein